MMNTIAKNERRHSIWNNDISLARNGGDDCSGTVVSSVSSNSYRSDGAIGNASESSSPPSSPPQLFGHHWRIESPQISELPEIYPKLFSPLIVRDREVSEIGDQLWSFLRANEIRSAYDIEEGRVVCCANRANFVVQFWKRKIEHKVNVGDVFANNENPSSSDNSTANTSTDNSNNREVEIILEIQRRKGCSWTMHKIRSAMKKSILRKQEQQRQHAPHHRRKQHTKPPPIFPPRLPRPRSAGFDLVGLESLLLPNSVQPLELTNNGSNNITLPKNEGSTSGTKPTALPIAEVRNPLFSYSKTPLRPTFYGCPKPNWRWNELKSTAHQF